MTIAFYIVAGVVGLIYFGFIVHLLTEIEMTERGILQDKREHVERMRAELDRLKAELER